MAQDASTLGYPSVFSTSISSAEGSEASKSEASKKASDAGSRRARDNAQGDFAPSDWEGPGGEDPGELRRWFFRTVGAFVALAGLALALLAGPSTGSIEPDKIPNDSTGARPPQGTEETGPEGARDTAPPEKPSEPSGSESSSKPSETKPPAEEPSEAESAKTESSKTDPARSRSGSRSYRYLGSVSRSVPETRALNNATGAKGNPSGTRSSETGSPTGAEGQGDSPDQSGGHVPELTIRLGDRSLEAVAAEFGYQMVAVGPSGENSSESVVLGEINGGRLQPMDGAELNRYAGRARSARKHPEYGRLRRRVARRLPDRSAGDVRLIYLVPKEVERTFVRSQMEAIRKRGLAPQEVAVVKARYRGDSIEVTGIERKSSP